MIIIIDAHMYFKHIGYPLLNLFLEKYKLKITMLNNHR